MKAPGVAPRHSPIFCRPRGPEGLSCPPSHHGGLSNGRVPKPVSLERFPMFSCFPTQLLTPTFSDSPQDSWKGEGQGEPPQWGSGDRGGRMGRQQFLGWDDS